MKADGKRKTVPMRRNRGRRYVDYDKQDLAVLAAARAWLNANGLKRFDLDERERARRAEIYCRQLEQAGRIEYLPAAPQHQRQRPTSRFAQGDALGRHLAG